MGFKASYGSVGVSADAPPLNTASRIPDGRTRSVEVRPSDWRVCSCQQRHAGLEKGGSP